MTRLIRRESERIALPEHKLGFTVEKGKYFLLPSFSPYPVLRGGTIIAYQGRSERLGEDVCLGLFPSPSILGEPISQIERPFVKKVLAVEDCVLDIVKRRDHLNPELLGELTHFKDIDSFRTDQRMAMLAASVNTLEKTAWVLLLVSASQRDRQIPLTQQLLADLIGGSRVSVNGTLKRLERSGILINESANYKIATEEAEEYLKRVVNSVGEDLLPSNIPAS